MYHSWKKTWNFTDQNKWTYKKDLFVQVELFLITDVIENKIDLRFENIEQLDTEYIF